MFHNHETELYIFKANLFNDELLIFDAEDASKYDYEKKVRITGRADNITLNYFTNVTIAEGAQFGYGELCYIPDVIVSDILNVVNNITPEVPEAIKKLKSVLPEKEFKEYFPHFAANNATYFSFDFINVGKRNENNKNCSSVPYPETYNSTANNRRQYERFRTEIGHDLTGYADDGERDERQFIATLNKYKYCSPYV